MAGSIAYFGIRHHGPGSARRLVEALDALVPACVLIEGPSDASALLPLLADPAMVPPVALLIYAEDDPARSSFFPFAEYSPEYQAVLWAVRHGAMLRFIDLPSADRLAGDGDELPAERELDPLELDPIGTLARAAGYEDGESWWRDVIEENPAPGPIFDAVADAMGALRAGRDFLSPREAAREAHMRLEIAKAAKETDGPTAVVCGAWHVPALKARHSATADRALLKSRPKTKTKATFAPWTAPRLARASGYGAGVIAPGWYQHLWTTEGSPDRDTIWLARIAALMRKKGNFVSTASVIEARHLGDTLARLRGRPAIGFEELRDAVLACLCFGERVRWDDIATELLIGSDVGEIPASTPLAPLLDDLQRQQRATRLKPEALERELAIDLRSENGLARSSLLHRLVILDVPWGRLAPGGRSRGTFRENWLIAWEPEYAVRLVEHLVYGATIADAAAARLAEAMAAEPDLGTLAGLVRNALLANLPVAVRRGLDLLQETAARTSDVQALLKALPPMADIVRYGEARAGAAAHLADLMPRIVIQAALALPYAVRNLDEPSTAVFRAHIIDADRAIALAVLGETVAARWQDALQAVLNDPGTTRAITGLAARLLYEADRLSVTEIATLLDRMLSPGVPVAEAAGFFGGFFDGAGKRLIHDAPLRAAVDRWLIALDEDDFIANLPLFRRVFGVFDKTERRRMMDALFGRSPSGAEGYQLVDGADVLWQVQFARIVELFQAGRAP